MLRPRPLSRALATVGVALALLGAAAPAGATLDDGGERAGSAASGVGLTPGRVSARTADPSTPLDPTIDRLSRAVIPKKGLIRVSGTVTNDDSVTWHNVRVYPFIGGQGGVLSAPMTTEAELRQASTSDPTIPVGDRLTQADCMTACVAEVGDLAPGQTATYSLVINRDDLDVSVPGIYWFGVHTLGETDTQAFDTNADGRARTFLPLLPDRGKQAGPEAVSLLLPIRRRVLYRPDGSIADVDRWATDLTTGRLGAVVGFGNATSSVTWLVDPAVLDAVRRLAAGNPGRSLTGRSSAATGPTATPTPETSPVSPPSPSESPAVTDPGTQAAQNAAKAWLASFQTAVKGDQVLGLPYGDPDVSALATHDRSLFLDARSQAEAAFKQLGISDTPVVAPLSGYLSHAALRMIGHQTLTVVGDQMIAGRTPALAQVGRDQLHTTSVAAAAGGPLPGDPLSPTTLRQRIIAEAALHASEGRPLTVSLPYDWMPPAWDARRFFAPFEQPWLSLQPLSAQTAPPRPVDPGRLRYPEAEADAQVQPYVIDAVRALVTAGLTLDSVLTNHPGVSDEVLDEALTSVSYTGRSGRGDAALRSEQHIASQLNGIKIEPPTAVTLSSDTGRFAVTISNALPEPVTVQLTPITDRGLDVRVPKDLSIPADGSSSVLLTAAAKTNGVHFVTLQLADSTGAQLGTGVRIPIRTAQVSRIIWAFVGVGLGLLFSAIAVRLVRRIRAARREAA